MVWAFKADILTVPCINELCTIDPNVNRYRYAWIYSVQWSQICYHHSRSKVQDFMEGDFYIKFLPIGEWNVKYEVMLSMNEISN